MIKQIDPQEQAGFPQKKKSFGADADIFLLETYRSSNAESVSQKITLLENQLGESFNFHKVGGLVFDEERLACLEFEFLFRKGLLMVEFR